MEAFLQFLRDYWYQIVTILVVIITLIISIIKKRPMTLDTFKDALHTTLNFVPSLVIKAEKEFPQSGSGTAKLNYVLGACSVFLASLLGRNLSSTEMTTLTNEVEKCVDEVLTAPVKKGE